MIGIVDYGAGNLRSIKNALKKVCSQVKLVSTPQELKECSRIVLPGVGAFGQVMTKLEERGLKKAIHMAVAEGKPFLGICVGMQVLFEESEESPDAEGLGIFRGKVVRLRAPKVPHMGWNKVVRCREGLVRDGYAYFAHSYRVITASTSIVSAYTSYSERFPSAVECRNVLAVQFHPEKSSSYGLELLQRWVRC